MYYFSGSRNKLFEKKNVFMVLGPYPMILKVTPGSTSGITFGKIQGTIWNIDIKLRSAACKAILLLWSETTIYYIQLL